MRHKTEIEKLAEHKTNGHTWELTQDIACEVNYLDCGPSYVSIEDGMVVVRADSTAGCVSSSVHVSFPLVMLLKLATLNKKKPQRMRKGKLR